MKNLSIDKVFLQFLATNPQLPTAVAYSGGVDSTTLLHLYARYCPGQVRAIHIHHGLQTGADTFSEHCQKVCRQLNIPLAIEYVNAKHAPRQSPEDAARIARYKAFDTIFHRTKDSPFQFNSIALAQHADDQVETLLIALSRGSGLPGLCAMPQILIKNKITFYRPLLSCTRHDIEAWLEQQNISYINDPTNFDLSYSRNRIRHQILPALHKTFGKNFHALFMRSSAHFAQAQTLLEELAQVDWGNIAIPHTQYIKLHELQKLSTARQINVLRYWLAHVHHTQANTAQMNELIKQIQVCTTKGHHIDIKIGSGYAQRRFLKINNEGQVHENALTWVKSRRIS